MKISIPIGTNIMQRIPGEPRCSVAVLLSPVVKAICEHQMRRLGYPSLSAYMNILVWQAFKESGIVNSGGELITQELPDCEIGGELK